MQDRPALSIHRALSPPRKALARRGARLIGGVLAEPGDRLLQALFERCRGGEVEQLSGAAGVEAAAGLAVGLGGVPDELALEAGEAGYQLGEVANGDLARRADVDRLGAVEALGRGDDRLGAVVDVEELARR